MGCSLSVRDGRHIRIVGPRELRALSRDERARLVDTTSHAPGSWMRGLSPFFLGPVQLPDGRRAANVENAWQFSKVYAVHADAAGNPTSAYQRWSEAGFADPRAHRYPMGKGARPLYVLCGRERLDYVQARLRVYWPVYRDAVARSSAFDRLEQLLQAEGRVTLFDFDGYDHDAQDRALARVIHDPHRKMGHAFVLKAMLLFGRHVDPHDIVACTPEQQPLALDSDAAANPS